MVDNLNPFSMFKITSRQVIVIQIYPGVIKAMAALLNETKRSAGFLGVPPHHPSRFLDSKWRCETCNVENATKKHPAGAQCRGAMRALPNIAAEFTLDTDLSDIQRCDLKLYRIWQYRFASFTIAD